MPIAGLYFQRGDWIEEKKMETAERTIKTFSEMVPGIRYAFIHSSFSKRPKKPEGEVDLMVGGARIWLKGIEASQKTRKNWKGPSASRHLR